MIRILLVEDQEIVRRGLRLLLDTQADIEIVNEAENGQQAIDQMIDLASEEKLPDVVMMDIKMPVMDGVAATQAITQQFPEAKIVVLTTFEDNQFVAQALRYGAKGYLLKDTPLEELADVIRSIARGYTQFGPGILEKMIADQAPNSSPISPQPLPDLPPGFESLTPKEKEVLQLVAQGANNKEIAASLFLSEGTVRNHISNILSRLNLRDRTQAAIVANAFMGHLKGNSIP
ncbi:MAG: response regulator transcription factor [Leptolyngbya sp. SIO1E4]|nr:response regulator transcription factor [Leptolyngbya sp. SIO1E4]